MIITNSADPLFDGVVLRNSPTVWLCAASYVHDPPTPVTLNMADEDLIALLKGELNGMQAFMTGKLQLEGDLMLAQRISTFFDPSKLQ